MKNTGARMAHSGIIQSDSVAYSFVFVANQCLVTIWLHSEATPAVIVSSPLDNVQLRQEGRIVLRTPVKL